MDAALSPRSAPPSKPLNPRPLSTVPVRSNQHPFNHPSLSTLPELTHDENTLPPQPLYRPLTPPSSGTASPALRPRIVDYDGLCAPSLGTRQRLSEPASDALARSQRIEDAAHPLLDAIGEDPTRQGLHGTPARFARSLLESTRGYQQSLPEIVNDAVFEEESNDMVLVRDIELSSMCEHHLLPFVGKLHIGYIPNGKVLGLSKFARIAEMFARRLQIQERLTKQIADAVQDVLRPQGLAVVMEMVHCCMTCRGVEQGGSKTVTSSMQGMMRSRDRTRREFLALLRDR